jgi:hypothetical protein
MELLKIKIKALFYANDEEYGYRRIHATLVRSGEQVDDETVRKLMRQLSLEPCQPGPWRHSLTEQGPSGPVPDLVNRDFTSAVPGAKMVGDISAPRGALPYRPRSGRKTGGGVFGPNGLPGAERRKGTIARQKTGNRA